jgi:glycosyltransferase involved in cell wall biosynthesis
VPTLSIITINRNNAKGLKHTLASVLGQTDRDFEHVVIDGASSDGSRELLAATRGVDTWISEPDDGIYDALNKGEARARPGNTSSSSTPVIDLQNRQHSARRSHTSAAPTSSTGT